MSRTKAESWLFTRRDELKTLQERQTAAADELAGLEAKRAHAVKMLACGDLHQQRLIDECEPKIAALKTKREGLAGLIGDVEKAIADAQEVVDSIKAREAAETDKAYAAQEFADGQALAVEIPALVEKIAEAYAGVAQAVGEFQLAMVKGEDLGRRVGLPDRAPMEAAFMNMVPAVAAFLEAKGFYQFAGNGFFGNLPANMGMIKPESAYLQEHPGGQIDPQKYYAWQQTRNRALFIQGFQSKGGSA